MRPLRPLHPVFSPLAVRTPRRPERRRAHASLGLEPLEVRTLLSTPQGGPSAAASAEARSLNDSRPPGWMACIIAPDRTRVAWTFGSPSLALDHASLPPLIPAWPSAPRPARWQHLKPNGLMPRSHQPQHLPKLAPTAIVWPPRSGSPAPRPVHTPTPRFQVLAPRTTAWSGTLRPAPGVGGDGDRIARVAVYSSASFHGLRGPHLRFRARFPSGFNARVALPNEGR